MGVIGTLGLVLGSAFASGLNLYATVAVLGLLERYGGAHLPRGLEVLGNPLVIGAALALYGIEFAADKIPYVDHLWDVLHTFIRPFAAAVLAYGATSGAASEWRLVAALLAGGIAFTTHGTKASARVAINASPEPFSNSIVSLGEDAVAIFFAWMATTHPLLTAVLVILAVALCLYLFFKFLGFLRRVLRRLGWRSAASAS